MVKVDCAQKILDIDGKETPTTVGMFLSEIMWVSRENQARSGQLAKKFRQDVAVELLAEDADFIAKMIVMVGARAGEAAQVLELLGKGPKEETKKEDK